VHEEAWNMSAAMKVAGAAGLGAFASWLIDGEFTWKSLARLFGNMIISGMMAVVVMFFVTTLAHAPEFAQWATAGIVGGMTNQIMKRLQTLSLSVKVAGIEAGSKGIENDAK
jgi:hypothetical protein